MAPHATSQHRDSVRQFFTGNAADYSNLFVQRHSGRNFAFRERLDLARDMTAGISGRLLDCACGPGEVTAAILASGCFEKATVVDLSPRMLEMAQQRLAMEPKTAGITGLEFKCSDIFEFATQPELARFDLILCLGLIAHTGRLAPLLASLKTLLTPNGKILLQSSLLDHPGMKVVRALTSGRYYRRHGYRISYFRHRDILQTARDTGLEPIAVRRFSFGLPFGDRLSEELNFRLERSMRNWARSHGAEALYLLGQIPHE